jgi:hypothetical protein
MAAQGFRAAGKKQVPLIIRPDKRDKDGCRAQMGQAIKGRPIQGSIDR